MYLKLRVIGEIEPNKSGEESNISLSEGVSSEVAVCRQNAFNTIQCSKHFPHSHVIGSLGPGKTSTVHTIVDLPADVHGLILISEYTDVELHTKIQCCSIIMRTEASIYCYRPDKRRKASYKVIVVNWRTDRSTH